MNVLEWSEPPRFRERDRFVKIAAELQTRPGEWAKVAENETQQSAYSNVKRQLQAHGCEVKVRKQGDGGGWSCWARVAGA